MVRRRQRERSLFEVLLPDGHKLWPDWLRKIDTLLENVLVGRIDERARISEERRDARHYPDERFSTQVPRHGVITLHPVGKCV
jgi:hypothetical protein